MSFVPPHFFGEPGNQLSLTLRLWFIPIHLIESYGFLFGRPKISGSLVASVSGVWTAGFTYFWKKGVPDVYIMIK